LPLSLLRKKKRRPKQSQLHPHQPLLRLQKAKQPSLLIRKPIPKPKLLRSNPLRKSLLLEGNDNGFLIDDEDYLVDSRFRYKLVLVDKNGDVDDLSDEIKWKLFLARQVALLKYQEVWG
jgi:hypothetical protein